MSFRVQNNSWWNVCAMKRNHLNLNEKILCLSYIFIEQHKEKMTLCWVHILHAWWWWYYTNEILERVFLDSHAVHRCCRKRFSSFPRMMQCPKCTLQTLNDDWCRHLHFILVRHLFPPSSTSANMEQNIQLDNNEPRVCCCEKLLSSSSCVRCALKLAFTIVMGLATRARKRWKFVKGNDDFLA